MYIYMMNLITSSATERGEEEEEEKKKCDTFDGEKERVGYYLLVSLSNS